MTAGEAIEKIQDAYDYKKLTLNQRQLYLDYLNRYPYHQISSLVDMTIQESKYFPRIADFHSVAKDLNMIVALVMPTPRRTCRECEGTGWLSIRVIANSGETVKAVTPCSCFPRPKYTPKHLSSDGDEIF